MPRHLRRRFGSPLTTKVEKITGHQSVRGRGGVIAVLYKTHWVGLSEPSWERETDLQLPRTHVLRFGAGTPDQHRQNKRLYHRMRICAVERELFRNNGERFWCRTTLVSHARSVFAAIATRCSPRELTFDARATMGCGGVEKPARVRRGMEYTWSDFWTTQSWSSFLPPSALYDLDEGRTRCLVLPGPRSQRVPSVDPT